MKRTVLITGTSKGIGLSLAKVFLENNYAVIGTSRNGKIEELKHPEFESYPLDLSINGSIDSFVDNFKKQNRKIDFIINNAGIGPDLDFNLPEEKTFRETFEVNVIGTTFLTELLIQYLNRNGKIINISSKMGSVGICKLTDSVAYRMSKTALNMYTKILTNRLADKHHVASVHPGWVRTTIAKSNINGRLTPEESAIKIFEFAISDFETGIYWNVESESKMEW